MKLNVETTVAAPIEQVWRAYTTPAEIKQWTDNTVTNRARIAIDVGKVQLSEAKLIPLTDLTAKMFSFARKCWASHCPYSF